MVSIGIDPSITSTGVVVLKDSAPMFHTVIQTAPKDGNMFERVTTILLQLKAILDTYPDALVLIEAPAFAGRGSRVYQLFGTHFLITLLLFRVIGKEVTQIAPTSVKKFATDNGRASKEEMLEALPDVIKEEFMLTHKKTKGLYDVVDAYWIACMHRGL